MSILWETYLDNTHYSVRQAGASIRLYTNDVYHTQWNPNKPFAGAVWDCLSLPALYRPRDSLKRVLLLGLGGGAVIKQLDLLCHYDELVAVELDPIHVEIAQKWFGINDPRVTTVTGDAIKWLKQYTGKPFDLIIDDLFFDEDGEPERAQPLNSSWLKRLSTHLTDEGLLVMNTVHRSELDAAIPHLRKAGFIQGMSLSVSQYDNAIGVVAKKPLSKTSWFAGLRASSLDASMRRQAISVKRRQFFSD